MFTKLKQRWRVSGTQLVLILCVFAITGTLTAWITRQVTGWMGIDRSSAWFWIMKFVVLLFGYQVIILLVAIPFRQFSFFWAYEQKILHRLGLLSRKDAGMPDHPAIQKPPSNMQPPVYLAIFASGTGSNARQIINYFRMHAYIKVALVLSNKPDAGVLDIAAEEKIRTVIIEKDRFFRGDAYVSALQEANIGFIVLAGFLWKIPGALIHSFPGKIINIHPALLPKYGGKGMYGNHVHSAVIAAGDRESGITIHYVDEHYDHGAPIFQVICPVEPGETPASLAAKIHKLEHQHFPRVIEEVIQNRIA